MLAPLGQWCSTVIDKRRWRPCSKHLQKRRSCSTSTAPGLVDSVYQPVLAWRSALSAEGIEPLDLAHPSQDRHERRLVHQHALARDGIPRSILSDRTAAASACGSLQTAHSANIQASAGRPRAPRLFDPCRDPVGDCDQWPDRTARQLLAKLDIDLDRIPIVTRDQVKYAKPDPISFGRGRPIASRNRNDFGRGR